MRLRLRPGERLAINGAVVRNGSNRSVELEVLNTAILLHERDIMLPAEADSPLKAIYLAIQLMHLEPEQFQQHHTQFIKSSSLTYAQALQEGDHTTCNLVTELVSLVGERSFVPALKKLQKVIGRPRAARAEGQAADPPEAS